MPLALRCYDRHNLMVANRVNLRISISPTLTIPRRSLFGQGTTRPTALGKAIVQVNSLDGGWFNTARRWPPRDQSRAPGLGRRELSCRPLEGFPLQCLSFMPLLVLLFRASFSHCSLMLPFFAPPLC
jgi:hypothetical protein